MGRGDRTHRNETGRAGKEESKHAPEEAAHKGTTPPLPLKMCGWREAEEVKA